MPTRLLQILLLATITLIGSRPASERKSFLRQQSRRRFGHCHFPRAETYDFNLENN